MVLEGGCEEAGTPKSLSGHLTVNTVCVGFLVGVSLCVDPYPRGPDCICCRSRKQQRQTLGTTVGCPT